MGFEITKEIYTPKFESSTPPKITQKILENKQFSEIPQLPSSTIEDFIIKQIQNGVKEEDTIVNNFFSESICNNLNQVFKKIKTISDSLNWDEIMNDNNILNIKQDMVSEMESMAISNEKIDEFRTTKIIFTDERGTSISNSDKNEIKINLSQIIRKALDYQLINNYTPINTIIKALAINTIAHELGHQIQRITNPNMPHEWKDDIPGERFAEGWARYISNKNNNKSVIIEQSRIMQVAKVDQIWQLIKETNLDLIKIFKEIKEKSNPKYKNFIEARRLFYGEVAPENYALPYSFEQIKNGLKKN